MPPSRCAASGATRLDAPWLGSAPRSHAAVPPDVRSFRDTRLVRTTRRSREAALVSRALECPPRAQERRGLTREAPGSAGDDSVRSVARTLRVTRRNQGREGLRSGREWPRDHRTSTSSQRRTATARCSTARGHHDRVPAGGALASSASRRRPGPGLYVSWEWEQSGGRHSARWASRTSPLARQCHRCNSIGNLGTTASATSRREGWSASPAGVSSRAGSAAGRSCGPGACAPSRSGPRPQGWPPC